MEIKLRTEDDRAAIIDCIRKLPLSYIDPLTVKWSKHKKCRSLSQNRLYWLWIACISNETGHNSDELHEYFRISFLVSKMIDLGDTGLLVPPSTTKLNTAEFKTYLDKIQIWASSELGCILPDPEDLHFQQFYEQYKNRL